MRAVLIAFGRALLSQLHIRMLLLTLVPFGLSLLVWGVALWFGLQPMMDGVGRYFADNDGFRTAADMLGWLGLGALKAVVVPFVAMWVLLPLMILTALFFVALAAMPAVSRHVSRRHYPDLVQLRGGSLSGSLWTSVSSLLIFILVWLVTLPLLMVPPIAVLIQPALWGWLTYRVMAYDALADHASAQERKAILRAHRLPLFVIGTISAAMGAAPTLLWLGGALMIFLVPVIAAVSIWLYVLVFIFTGLWFQYYCMEALASYRRTQAMAELPVLPQ
jgi:hypothetical protein